MGKELAASAAKKRPAVACAERPRRLQGTTAAARQRIRKPAVGVQRKTKAKKQTLCRKQSVTKRNGHTIFGPCRYSDSIRIANVKQCKGHISVGSVCSGLLTEKWALEAIGVASTHKFAAEKNKHLQRFLQEHHEVDRFYNDVTDPQFLASVEAAQLFIAGFPCQPWSAAGQSAGIQDRRGHIIVYIVEYITTKLPNVFVLENVAGLLHRHGESFARILEMLHDVKDPCTKKAAYSIKWKLLNSAHVGAVPQNRERIYIVGILNSRKKCNFTWPEPIPTPRLHTILDAIPARPHAMPTQSSAKQKVEKALEQARGCGLDPTKDCVVVNCDGITSSWKVDWTPCLTAARGATSGFWISHRGARMSVNELFKLQGMSYHHSSISKTEIGKALGNSFTQSVIARILVRALPAAGLTGTLHDPWQPQECGVPISTSSSSHV
jgi:DNA-cytosine methyltransferase